MMQAFRNSAKVAGAIFALLMLIFMATSVDWGSLTRSTSVGGGFRSRLGSFSHAIMPSRSVGLRRLVR